MNPQAMLNYLLGVPEEGAVLYSIYSDCANKINSKETGQGFDVDKDGWVSKSYDSITESTGIWTDTVRSSIERLIKRGLLQKKPGNVDTYNIPLYKPEFKSSVFIKIAKERLKTPTGSKLDQQYDKEVIPEIISTFEKDPCVLVALGLVKSSQETKSSHEFNPPQEIKSPEDEYIIKYVSVLQRKWEEEEMSNNE